MPIITPPTENLRNRETDAFLIRWDGDNVGPATHLNEPVRYSVCWRRRKHQTPN